MSDEEKRLRAEFYNIALEELQRAREHLDIDNRILRSQQEASKYFKKDVKTIKQWEKEGMPHGASGRNKYYDKVLCWNWILAQ